MISDLHLSPESPQLAALFEAFIKTQIVDHSRPPESLIILGDLFDYWIGDDAAADIGQTQNLNTLRTVSDAGTRLYFVHGNRDFLVGPEFERATGAKLLDAISLIDLPGARIVTCHGDELCTDDVEHQKFRAMVRDAKWQTEFLSQPIAERQAYAGRAREMSETSKSAKSMEIMDVSTDAVDALMNDANVHILVHGHTHRPAVHNGDNTRLVLGDWQTSASYLDISDGAMTLESGSGRAGGTVLLQT